MFEMHLVHIDESAAAADPEVDAAYPAFITQLRASLEAAGCAHPLHVVPLEDVYGDESDTAVERCARLQALLALLPDATMRQDLVAHLRQCALALAARRLECNKTILGDSASTLATAFVAAAAKVRVLRCCACGP